jgi:predicted amidohydrolase YtcJ
MNYNKVKILVFVHLLMFSTLLVASDTADMVFIGGKIWTSEAAETSATALAIKGNRILSVGSDEAVKKQVGPETKIIQLDGKLVTPGFIDNHTHFIDTSGLISAVKVRDVTSKTEFIQKIAAYASKMQPGSWMLYGVWDHEAWGGQLPRADWIDRVTNNIPVYLWRTDGHMALANSAAMKIAGVNKNTADVAGGEIVRDKDGKPTGIFKDAAMDLITQVIPPIANDDRAALFQAGIDHALSQGVTQIHNMGTWDDLRAFQTLQNRNQLAMRVYSFVPLQTYHELAQLVKQDGRGNAMHRWGGLKAMVDGSLGSTTAWFYQAYSDEPDKFGFPIHELKAFRGWIESADKAGLHITIHAIGDRANDWILDTFEDIAKHNPPNPQRRWRIEHAQHLSPAAISRFKPLSVIASMQPYHAIDDGRWAEKRIGSERIKQTYAFRSLIDAKAQVTFGSDSPVAPMSVMEGIYAAVTRQTLDGRNPEGWVPEEKISVTEALTAYTLNNAYAGFQETELGQLKPGYLADMVVLDNDILNIPPTQIKDVEVVLTVVNGVIVYQK